ncbi:MAG: hypothetical protein ACYCQJ_15615 [Nitrososphaerales archaeon]
MLVPDLIYETLLQLPVYELPRSMLRVKWFHDYVTRTVLEFPYSQLNSKGFSDSPGKIVIENQFSTPFNLLPSKIHVGGKIFHVNEHIFRYSKKRHYLRISAYCRDGMMVIKLIMNLQLEENGRWYPGNNMIFLSRPLEFIEEGESPIWWECLGFLDYKDGKPIKEILALTSAKQPLSLYDDEDCPSPEDLNELFGDNLYPNEDVHGIDLEPYTELSELFQQLVEYAFQALPDYLEDNYWEYTFCIHELTRMNELFEGPNKFHITEASVYFDDEMEGGIRLQGDDLFHTCNFWWSMDEEKWEFD